MVRAGFRRLNAGAVRKGNKAHIIQDHRGWWRWGGAPIAIDRKDKKDKIIDTGGAAYEKPCRFLYTEFLSFLSVFHPPTPPCGFYVGFIPPAPIEKYLENLFITPDQFVILTAPEAQYKVRYVQACTHDEGIEVELGIEEEGTCLYYKMCSQEECRRIFLDFFDNIFIPGMDEYKLVEF